MKENLLRGLRVAIALLLLVLSGVCLLVYSRPMEDVTLDLSLIDKSANASPETPDEKGWQVYTREGDTVTELEPTGQGFYQGIELGQTLYLSRVMVENLDNPTLQIGTAERTFTVWLDDEVIYTDWPELDNRIGHLHLPMNEESRSEPISITLPMDYQGKTLTIAQSTPPYSETPTLKAAPASVVLYCGYAYESGIIAESYSLAIGAAGLFAVGLALLLAFVRRRDWSMLCIALTAFSAMGILLTDASFLYRYFGTSFHYYWYLRWFAALALMAFLVMKAGSHRKFPTLLLGICIAWTPVSLVLYTRYINSILLWPHFLYAAIPELLFLLSMAVTLIHGLLYWRKESGFYRLYTPLALGGLVVYWTISLVRDPQIPQSIYVGLISGNVNLLYNGCLLVSAAAALAAALWDAVQSELKFRTEKRLMEQHRQQALASYENMRRQHEEVMMLRHDMNRHFLALRELTGETVVQAYLDELIGQNKKIRPVVQSGNEMLDIILNSKLSVAADARIPVEIFRAQSPETLPLSDADLCSLIMNILDNAITAAAGAAEPHIRLDIHVKNEYLTFICENTMSAGTQPQKRTETVAKHGFGLKIIRSIAARYEGLMDIEYSENTCKVQVALPLT